MKVDKEASTVLAWRKRHMVHAKPLPLGKQVKQSLWAPETSSLGLTLRKVALQHQYVS